GACPGARRAGARPRAGGRRRLCRRPLGGARAPRVTRSLRPRVVAPVPRVCGRSVLAHAGQASGPFHLAHSQDAGQVPRGAGGCRGPGRGASVEGRETGGRRAGGGGAGGALDGLPNLDRAVPYFGNAERSFQGDGPWASGCLGQRSSSTGGTDNISPFPSLPPGRRGNTANRSSWTSG